MIEGTPGQPYGGTMSEFNTVEDNMRKRREEATSVLAENQALCTITSFPRLVPVVVVVPPLGCSAQCPGQRGVPSESSARSAAPGQTYRRERDGSSSSWMAGRQGGGDRRHPAPPPAAPAAAELSLVDESLRLRPPNKQPPFQTCETWGHGSPEPWQSSY